MRRASIALLLALAACDAPSPPVGTGGTDAAAGECGRGLVVVASDYQSTNVSLIDVDGAVLSSSFLSSASTTTGLSAPLSGDVVAPTMPATNGRIVLIDRYPAGVLTWVDATTGAVAGQLTVNQGFAANPQDYAAIDDGKAYVSRLQPNPSPGHAPFDGGSDVLVVDPSKRVITGRIDLASAMKGEDPSFYPRPNRILVDGDRVLVLLSAYSLSFDASAPSRAVVIDPKHDTIVSVHVLDGVHGCTGLGLSPAGGKVAVACSGTFKNNQAANLGESGLVVLSRDGDVLSEELRIPAAELGEGPLGFSAAFADASTVLITTFGHDAANGGKAADDTAVAINLSTKKHEVLLRSNGVPFTLGEVRCASACGACFVTDAATQGGVVDRLFVRSGALSLDHAVRVDTAIGLPPRYLGAF
jgi:hypothetical protein